MKYEDDKLTNYVNCYLQKFADSITTPHKIKWSVAPEFDNLFGALLAAYQLYVEQRGRTYLPDDHTQECLKKVTNWMLQSKRFGLLLIGPIGSGKTTTLRSIKRVYERAEKIDADTIYANAKKNEAIDDSVYSQNLLLLDDLGAEPEKCKIYGDELHPLRRFIIKRYDLYLPTIITTNLTTKQIKDRYGDRLYDRIIEMYDVIVYSAPSYRSNTNRFTNL